MKVNVTLDENDISTALENYIKQNAPVPIEGELVIDLIPAKGAAGAYAIVSFGAEKAPVPSALDTKVPAAVNAAAVGTTGTTPAATPYDAMERAAVLQLCTDRGIAIRGENATKDKRTTSLIKELVAWDNNQPVDHFVTAETQAEAGNETVAVEEEISTQVSEAGLFEAAPPADTETVQEAASTFGELPGGTAVGEGSLFETAVAEPAVTVGADAAVEGALTTSVVTDTPEMPAEVVGETPPNTMESLFSGIAA